MRLSEATASARFLLSALWCGSLWTVGFLVAPVLFATLSDRSLAGTIAGGLFRVEAWASLIFGVILFVLNKITPQSVESRKRVFFLIASILICVAVSCFVLQPLMAALRDKAGVGSAMQAGVQLRFNVLHGASSALYFLESLLAVKLMFSVRLR